jgi:hypothetical protein
MIEIWGHCAAGTPSSARVLVLEAGTVSGREPENACTEKSLSVHGSDGVASGALMDPMLAVRLFTTSGEAFGLVI